MPNTQKRAEPPTEEEKARIVTGPDPDRFYCPHPGCNRSFAELWRLKVHFRAPPDVRGSGKERGHGTELQFCPKCGKDLRPGKHHVGCSAGKSAPRQAAKRQRQQQMSTTTESAGLTTGTTEQTTGSWEITVRRPPAKQQRQVSEVESAQRSKRAAAEAAAVRIEGMATGLDPSTAGHGAQEHLLFHPHPLGAHAAAAPGAGMAAPGPHMQQFFAHSGPDGGGAHGAVAGAMPVPAAAAGAQQHAAPPADPLPLPHLDLPQHHGGDGRPHSPSPLDLFGDPFAGATNGHGGADALGGGGGHGQEGGGQGRSGGGLLDDDDSDMLRIPSPPPLPADWEIAATRPGLLFDFDQFDATKRHQQTGGASAPLVTVTTAMNPVDVLNPSDDYIWQILFAGENDAVPKRVTAHLHHPPATALSYLDDDTDPLLDAILADDLPPAPPGFIPHHHGLHMAAPHQDHHPAPGGSGGSGGTVPVAGSDAGGTATGGAMLPCLDAVFGQQQVVPQQPHQLLPHLEEHQQPQPAVLPYRNGFGSHAAPDMVPAAKLEGATAAAGSGFL